tara:strand:- start:3490 stop:5487 length:1998 start_codon:yes stop_codon:yes gene_type:complete
MAIKFLDAIDLTGLEVQNVLAQSVAGNPTALGEGQFFFDSTSKIFKYWNGASWVSLDGQGGVTSLLDGVGTLVSSATGSVAVNLNLVGPSNYVLEGIDLSSSPVDIKSLIPFSDAAKNVSFAAISDLPFTANTGTVTSITNAANTGTGTAITGAGTFTYTGAGLISTAVSGTTVTISTTATSNTGTVTSVGPANGTFVSSSSAAITGAGTLTYDLSASGTASATTYLRGDNSWATIAAGFANFAISADSGTAATIDSKDDILFTGAGGIATSISTVGTTSTVGITLGTSGVTAGTYASADITVDAQGRVTAAAAGGSGTMTSFDVGGDKGADQVITNGNKLSILGGEGIVTEASATDTLTATLALAELPVRTVPIDGLTDYFVGLFDKGADQNKSLIKDLSLSELGAPTKNLSIGYKLTNVVDPTVAQDAATKNYVDTTFAGSGALIYQGGYDASTAAPSAGVKQGWTYAVTKAGSGLPLGFWDPTLEVGDLVIANIDTPTTAADWTEINKNIDVATATVQGIANFPTAGGLSVSSGAVSMPNVGTASSVGSASKSLAITTDAKGRVTAKSATDIAIAASQVSNFCEEVDSCVDARSATGTIGDNTTWTIAHNLNTFNVMIQVYSNASPFETVQVFTSRKDKDTVIISVAVNPGASALNYMIVKV